jgi:hypothetical protein
MPIHLKRICSVIDRLPPNIDFEVSHGSELRLRRHRDCRKSWAAFSRNRRTLNLLHERARTTVSWPQLFRTRTPQTPRSLKEKIKQHSNGQRGSMLRNSRMDRCRASDRRKRPGKEKWQHTLLRRMFYDIMNVDSLHKDLFYH